MSDITRDDAGRWQRDDAALRDAVTQTLALLAELAGAVANPLLTVADRTRVGTVVKGRAELLAAQLERVDARKEEP
jgi:hypothetical protein